MPTPRALLSLIPAFFLLAACATAPPAPASPALVAGEAAEPARAPARFDAQLTAYAYPFEVKRLPLKTQQQTLEMAYMDISPEANANGATVLLLHGKNFSGAYWETTIQALVKEGYRVVVPDQIGFGKSSKPERFQYSFHELAGHNRQLLDALGVGAVTVVGHSMGGMLATRFALLFPERTRQLVLINPIGLEDWKRVVPYTPVDAWFAAELKKDPEQIRDYMKASYFDGKWSPAYDQLAELQMGWTQDPDYPKIAWSSALTYDMIFTQPVLYEFKELRVPTLLIIGQRDRTALGKNLVAPEVAQTLGLYPELGRAAHAAIPNSKLVELEGIGHIPQLEAWPDTIAALLTFLADSP